MRTLILAVAMCIAIGSDAAAQLRAIIDTLPAKRSGLRYGAICSGSLHIPIDVAWVGSKIGQRVSLTTGFNVAK